MLWQSLSPHLLFCKTSADRCIRRWRAAQPCSPNPRHRHRLGFTHMETFIGQDSYQLKSTATQKKQSTGYGDTTGASKIVSVIKQKFLASYSQFTSRQTEVQQEEESDTTGVVKIPSCSPAGGLLELPSHSSLKHAKHTLQLPILWSWKLWTISQKGWMLFSLFCILKYYCHFLSNEKSPTASEKWGNSGSSTHTVFILPSEKKLPASETTSYSTNEGDETNYVLLH